ncbi:MAG: hypothetical protein AAF363_02090 [Bacteroidota bacterium]
MKYSISIIISLLILLASCNNECNENRTPVTSSEDYTKYLLPVEHFQQKLNLADESIHFWKDKIEKDGEGFVYTQKLAKLYRERFDLSGDINDVKHSDFYFRKTLDKTPYTKVPLIQNLASNAITQHKFQTALRYNNDILESAEGRYLTGLVYFDALMETGHYYKAKSVLERLDPKNTFGFLVRSSKLHDLEGGLEKAIADMEAAAELVGPSNKSLYCWAWSNLGDYYGHVGKYSQSYRSYLKVLEVDPGYLYALKGIAWIAFSNDRNPEEAKRLLEYVLERKPESLDLMLTLAEIEEFSGNTSEKDRWIARFLEEASKEDYGSMYVKYLIDLQLEEFGSPGEALTLAKNEVKKRGTFETYSWLAYSYLKSGDSEKALRVVKSEVLPYDYEPEVQYRLAKVYKASGDTKKARHYLVQAAEASYELGPVMAEKIEGELKSL